MPHIPEHRRLHRPRHPLARPLGDDEEYGEFIPSDESYGAVDPALISQGISAATAITTSAIAAGGRKGGGKKRRKAKMAEIEAAKPDYNPMWVVAVAILGVGGLGYMLLKKPAAAA